MKIATRQQHWFLINFLMFVPWISCQRLDVYGDSEETAEPRSLGAKRSVSFHHDNRFAPLRSGYRVAGSRELLYRAPAYRHFNPDFHFEYSQEEDPLGRSHSQPAISEKPKNNAGTGAEFSYQEKDKYGPSHWYRVAAQCGGRFQSPVLLNSSSALPVRRKRPLQLVGQTTLPQEIVLTNDGHSAKFTYVWNQGERPYIRGGPLKTKYYFEQFHFHWGANNSVGSEHLLDYHRYPMELHLVFYNALYPSFNAARAEVDGLAVMGLFYEIYDVYEEQLNTWTRFLKNIVEPEAEYKIEFVDTFPLYDLIGDVEWPYFSYEGSLTTPPCLETVTWIVSAKPLLITPKEIKEFRRLRSRTGPLVNNFRPVQKLYNRRVYRY